MLRSEHRIGCKTAEHPRIGRRQLLQAGGMAVFGMSLGDLLRLEAQAAGTPPTRAPKARSVVFIFQSGGASQHETWDPKPEAPEPIRGAYGAIGTTVAGLRVCEYLPRLAQRARKYAIVRTMYHPAGPEYRNEHSAAQYLLKTGTLALPPGETTNTIALGRQRDFEWPSFASMVAYALPPAAGNGLPPVVDLPRAGADGPGERPGLLGSPYARWRVDLAPRCSVPDGGGSCPNCFSHDQPNDPARKPGKGPNAWYDNSSCRDPRFHLPNLGLPASLTVARLQRRSELLEHTDGLRRALQNERLVRDMEVFRRRALDLVVAQTGKHNPFDLSGEAEKTRDLYGQEEWGQALLVARRLVEAGVRMVQVNLRGWDTHQNAFRDLKGYLLPSLDRSLSGFLDDMEARGLLDETLIVMCGEFGRTPLVQVISPTGKNAAGEPFTPGRDHWGDVFSCFFVGGGIRAGQVIGESDEHGGSPDGEGYTPADLAATIFHLLGIPREMGFHDVQGRPYRVYQGTPIAGLV